MVVLDAFQEGSQGQVLQGKHVVGLALLNPHAVGHEVAVLGRFVLADFDLHAVRGSRQPL